MNGESESAFLGFLDDRRKALGIPWDALSARSGTSRATLFRLLNDRHAAASFETVIAVAEALGVHFATTRHSFRAVPVDLKTFLDQQAERQARKLVGMVQGTMGLESQSLPASSSRLLIKKTKRELLEGPRRKLWYD